MMLGDFDARVGVFDPAEGLWHGTIGSHGIVESVTLRDII